MVSKLRIIWKQTGSLRQQHIEQTTPSSAADWATLEQHDPSGGLLGVVHPTMQAGDVRTQLLRLL